MACRFLSGLIAFLTLSSLHAEDEVAAQPPVSASETAKPRPTAPPPKPVCCGMSQKPMRITARHIESKGVGYDQGYSTLEGFFSPREPWYNEWTPFLDVRGHVFNNGKFAANVGLGARYLDTSRLWGANLYYDYRKTKRKSYNQISAGFESLGRVWDFRLNGYLPVGCKHSSWYDTGFGKFSGHTLYVSRKREFAMGSVNGEVGYHLDKFKDVPLYFAAGPYYLHGQLKTAWGGQIRARADVYEYLTLEANTSYDSAFHWIGQGQIGLNYYFGGRRAVKQGKNCSCPMAMTLSDRAIQRVDRNEIIPVDKRRKLSAADPFFIFVDNLSSSDGTWQSPYPTLQLAEANSGPNDIIYVLPGSGDPYVMTDDSGFDMQEGQRLWGAATTHSVDTQFGPIEVPAMANVMPKVQNTSTVNLATVVSMNANCEVSGIHVLGVRRGIGFAAQSAMNQSLSINRNLIEMSGGANTSGIFLQHTEPGTITALVTDNQCLNISSAGESTGIFATNGDIGNLTVLMTGNQYSNITGPGESSGILAENSAAGHLTVSIAENQFSNITSSASDAFASFVNNSGSGSAVASITNNQASNLSGGGATYAYAATNNTGSMTISVIDNLVFPTMPLVSSGVNIDNLSTGTLCATIIGNNNDGTAADNRLTKTGTGTTRLDPSSGNNTPALMVGAGVVFGSCP